MAFDQVVAARQAAGGIQVELGDGPHREQVLQALALRHDHPATGAGIPKRRRIRRAGLADVVGHAVVAVPRQIARDPAGVDVVNDHTIHSWSAFSSSRPLSRPGSQRFQICRGGFPSLRTWQAAFLSLPLNSRTWRYPVTGVWFRAEGGCRDCGDWWRARVCARRAGLARPQSGCFAVLGCDHKRLGESPPRSGECACVLPAKLYD